MEKSLKILVLCRNQQLLETLVRVIRDKSPWHAVVYDFNGIDLSALLYAEFDILLLGSGFSESEEATMEEAFKKHFPKKHLVYHYGGGSGLLFSEIRQKLDESVSDQVCL